MKKNSIRALRARVFAEALEGRQLLSSVVSSGVLQINGTANADTYFINKSGSSLIVTENGGVTKTYDYASITSINAILAGGNDTLTIANTVVKPSYLSGGAGNDAIIGGGGDDVIDPGIGNDYVEGRDGYDTLSYASRSDAITGNLHAHLLRSAADPFGFTLNEPPRAIGEQDTSLSVEVLAGGSGNDTLSTGSDIWNDNDEGTHPNIPLLRLDGNGGDDTFNTSTAYEGALGLSQGFPKVVADGGAGNDFFSFGSASSAFSVTLIGGAGNDTFEKREYDGSATLNPGSGIDNFNAYALSGTYTMPDDLENLQVSSTAGIVIGNAKNNAFRGGSYLSIDAGGGDDSIAVQSAGTVLGGSGNDFIQTNSYASYIDGGDDNDIIAIGASPFDPDSNGYLITTVLGGAGNDTLILDDADGRGIRRINFDGGSGSNHASLSYAFSDTNRYFRLNTGQIITSATGNGTPDDLINLTSVGEVSLQGGDHDDTFEVRGVMFGTNVVIDGRAGNDFFDIYKTSDHSELYLYSGYDGKKSLHIESDGTTPTQVLLADGGDYASLSIEEGATLTTLANLQGSKVLNVDVLTIDATSTLDLGNNPLMVDRVGTGTEATAVADLNAFIRRGRNGGTWDGTGIRSFTVPTASNQTLGVASVGDASPAFISAFGGSALGSAVVRLTIPGDLNLDRVVNFDDLIVLAQNYGSTGKTYAKGDINYSANGAVNFDDLVVLAQNYNKTLPTANLASTAVATSAKAGTTKKSSIAGDVVGRTQFTDELRL